jgi:ribosomal protein L40E
MVKFEEAEKRLFRKVFVCRVCKSKRKADIMKVLQGRIKCRNCNSKALRPVRKK